MYGDDKSCGNPDRPGKAPSTNYSERLVHGGGISIWLIGSCARDFDNFFPVPLSSFPFHLSVPF